VEYGNGRKDRDVSEFQCPHCAEQISADVIAEIPAQTDLTICLEITPGQHCQAKTIAGVIQNFADMQIAVGKELGVETSVYVVGLSYEENRISVTNRIVNTPSKVVSS